MKYNLILNQKAIINSGIDIDIIDSHILVSCMTFSHKKVCSKIEYNGKVYYWFSHEMIVAELPLLKLKKDSVYRRMKKMCELGLISQHPNNSTLGKSYYCIEELAMNFEYEPSDETPTPPVLNTDPPSDKKPNNHNTIYPNTNTNNISPSVSKETKKQDIKIINYIEIPSQTLEEKIVKQFHALFCKLRTKEGEVFNNKVLLGAKMSSWKVDLDKIMRIDKRSKEDLLLIYNFIKDGDDRFWANTISSLGGIRKNFDMIRDSISREKDKKASMGKNKKEEENPSIFKGDINRITKK